ETEPRRHGRPPRLLISLQPPQLYLHTLVEEFVLFLLGERVQLPLIIRLDRLSITVSDIEVVMLTIWATNEKMGGVVAMLSNDGEDVLHRSGSKLIVPARR